METNQALGCPFCGGKGVLDSEPRHKKDPDRKSYFYRCISCGAFGGWAKTEGNALRNWNLRIKGEYDRGLREGLERAAKELEERAPAFGNQYMVNEKFSGASVAAEISGLAASIRQIK